MSYDLLNSMQWWYSFASDENNFSFNFINIMYGDFKIFIYNHKCEVCETVEVLLNICLWFFFYQYLFSSFNIIYFLQCSLTFFFSTPRSLILLALSINTLICCVKILHKNGYLRKFRISETWNSDLRKSNLRMIMLQSLQVSKLFPLFCFLEVLSAMLPIRLYDIIWKFSGSFLLKILLFNSLVKFCTILLLLLTYSNYFIVQKIWNSIHRRMSFMVTMCTRHGMNNW